MSSISPTGLKRLLDDQPDALVLDVRTPVEYAQIHVREARLEPLEKFESKESIERLLLPKDKPVYLLCRSGTRAAKAAEALRKAGYDQPVVVEGGTLGWIQAGLPVERSEKNIISLERQVRIGAGSLVLLGVILSFVIHPAFIALSAFVGGGLVFAGITDWCGMGLLLAKAPWNQHHEP